MQGESRLVVIRHDLNEPRGPDSIPPPHWFCPGDWLAFILKPVAAFLDKWFKTHYIGCGPCGQRQAAINRWPSNVIQWVKKALTFYA